MTPNPYESGSVESVQRPTTPARAGALWRYMKWLIVVSFAVHGVLWVAMFAVEPFRPAYFYGHLLVKALHDVIGTAPQGMSLGHVIVTIPLSGVVIHTALIGLFGLVLGSLTSNASRGVVYGALTGLAFLLAANAAVAAFIFLGWRA